MVTNKNIDDSPLKTTDTNIYSEIANSPVDNFLSLSGLWADNCNADEVTAEIIEARNHNYSSNKSIVI